MKFSFDYVKKNPLVFGGIFLVFGVLFWLYLNQGAETQQSVTYADSGPSDAELAAQAALGQASIAANRDTQLANAQIAAIQIQGQNELALANLGAQVALADLGANERLQSKNLDYTRDALMYQLDTELALQEANNQFQVDFAKVAYDASTESTRINAALAAQMSSDQLKAFTTGAMFNSVQFVKKNDRDNAFALAAAISSGTPTTYKDRTSGSFSTGSNLAPTVAPAPVGQNSGGFGGVFGAFG